MNRLRSASFFVSRLAVALTLASLPLTASAQGIITIFDETFTGGNGGFTAVSGTPAWQYSLVDGVWFNNGAGVVQAVSTRFLRSPVYVVPYDLNDVTIVLNHRWATQILLALPNIPPVYGDTNQIRTSVNGGSFATPAQSSFSQNAPGGFAGVVNPVIGQATWGGQQPNFVDSVFSLGSLAAGTTLQFQFRHDSNLAVNDGGNGGRDWEISRLTATGVVPEPGE